jgi:hypothetical protein
MWNSLLCDDVQSCGGAESERKPFAVVDQRVRALRKCEVGYYCVCGKTKVFLMLPRCCSGLRFPGFVLSFFSVL